MVDHLLHGKRNVGLEHCDSCPECFPAAFASSHLTAKYHFTASDAAVVDALGADWRQEAGLAAC